MREKINFLRHLSILFLTLIFFFLGVFIGNSVEDLRVADLYTQLQTQDLSYQNIVTESQYLNFLLDSSILKNDTNSCDTITGSFYTSISNLDDSRLKLEKYINTASVNEDEYFRLKNHYENIQVNYWILANKLSSLCENQLNVILFFYDDKKKCPSCEDQGVYLDYVKKKLGDKVLIFSFDSQREGPINLISQRYDIVYSEKPIIIVNDEVHNYSNKDEIFEMLCEVSPNLEVCE